MEMVSLCASKTKETYILVASDCRALHIYVAGQSSFRVIKAPNIPSIGELFSNLRVMRSGAAVADDEYKIQLADRKTDDSSTNHQMAAML